jgi:hypothetical protein
MPYPAEEEGIERITKAAAAATDNNEAAHENAQRHRQLSCHGMNG